MKIIMKFLLLLTALLIGTGCSRDTNVILETGFESDLGGFAGRSGTETLTRTNEDNHSGRYSLKTEGRSSSWHGASLNITPHIIEGELYTLSAWIKLISPQGAALMLSTQIGSDSGASYINLQRKDIRPGDGWVEFRGTFRYLDTEHISLYVEGTPNDASFYIDDVKILREESDPIVIEDLPALKDIYKEYFLLGNIASARDLNGLRFELLDRHFNALTAENAMKPGDLQPSKGKFNWAAADAIVDRALARGMTVHGHTLVWHKQTGAWMTENVNREGALENMSSHIKTVVEHFKGRVDSWDVVNEAMDDGLSADGTNWKTALRKSPWAEIIGPEYIELAFLAAREAAGPDLKLYYNDYNLDDQNKAQAVFNMVMDINGRYPGLIDGIGMQGHYSLITNPQNVEQSLNRFISLGLEISISELDITAGSGHQLSGMGAKQQALKYAQLFALFKKYGNHISRVTLWGVDDGTSWRAAQCPVLFDRNLKAKEAFHAVSEPEKFTN